MAARRPITCNFRTVVKHSSDLVKMWNSDLAGFFRGIPSWENIQLVEEQPIDRRLSRIVIRARKSIFSTKLVFRFHYPVSGPFLRIRNEKGVFKYFEHQVIIREQGNGGCEMIDKVDYILRFPWLFPETRQKYAEKRFKKFFGYKQEVMDRDLDVCERLSDSKPKRILVSGSTGLIGSSLFSFLQVMGHDVWHLVRSKEEARNPNSIYYNWKTGEVNRLLLENFDCVYHLQGGSLTKRWTKKQKRSLMSSRYEATKALAKLLVGLKQPPKDFFCASAIGYYGDTGTKWVNELAQEEKQTFLAEICRAWENACALLKSRGVRVVHFRFGMVLSSRGGALQKMLGAFRIGLGGVFGTGKQYMSWVAIDDVVGAMHHVLIDETISGPINVVAPHPVTNREFSQTLAKRLKRKLGPPIPAFFLKLVKGQMASELLLTSTKVESKKLREHGYYFRYPFLKDALNHLIF